MPLLTAPDTHRTVHNTRVTNLQSFILALTILSPPSLPLLPLSPYRAQIHLYTHFTSLVLSIPLALSLALSAAPGRSVSFSTDFDLGSALERAAGGGLAGALAMVLQVLLLMPMRTVMNYQYRYGGSVRDGVGKLYADGGVRRYYAGMGAALYVLLLLIPYGLRSTSDSYLHLLSVPLPSCRLSHVASCMLPHNTPSSARSAHPPRLTQPRIGLPILKYRFQGPLARFGDTAANAFILSLLASLTWPVLIKTVAASLSSAAFRMILTPIDTLKTTQQTRGGEAGWKLLKERIGKEGVVCLWWGALATAAATFVGHCECNKRVIALYLGMCDVRVRRGGGEGERPSKVVRQNEVAQ